jgi:hypothetical protein
MRDAGLVEGAASRSKASASVEAGRTHLRVQQYLALATLARALHQRVQQCAADLGAAHRLQHGHAADLGHAR